ncbi:MAG TPA: stage V sporulation protein AD [Acholeplasmataceae bacterium]|jgi:stage V sporulation protein AD|nr:stage V sporulation protein AD [Acholeplasmataceae bacterium]
MKVGKQSIAFNNLYLHNTGVVVGPQENNGPLKDYFDHHYDDLHCGQKTWELAEMMLYRNAFNTCLNKNNLEIKDVDCLISGDLNNQIIIGNYIMRDYDIPYLGIFNACASCVEGMIIGGALIESKNANNVIVAMSSHYATTERQYRYPTEYGGQKPETSNTTVSAGTAALISNNESEIKITKATIGRILDAKLNDPLDLGRAMAPAAFHTLREHFKDFDVSEDDYDLIITGDLSYYGSDMFLRLCKEFEIDLNKKHQDGGLLIYDRENQEVFSGGTGCGCLPAVLYTIIRKQMLTGDLKKILAIATGALLNPVIMSQKETIPAIAHAVVLERV